MTGFGGREGPFKTSAPFEVGDRVEYYRSCRRGTITGRVPDCNCCVMVTFDCEPNRSVGTKVSWLQKLSILERIAEAANEA
jgi:hypothetical protein